MDRNESATRIIMGSVADKMHANVFERTHAAHLERNVNFEVAFASEAGSAAIDHLLQHYRKKKLQEDLCFALRRPSPGGKSPPLLRFLDRGLRRLAKSLILPSQRGQSPPAARQLGPGKCACMFARHGYRKQESKAGIQPPAKSCAKPPANERLLREEHATGSPTRGEQSRLRHPERTRFPGQGCLVETLPGGGASTPSPHDRTLTARPKALARALTSPSASRSQCPAACQEIAPLSASRGEYGAHGSPRRAASARPAIVLDTR